MRRAATALVVAGVLFLAGLTAFETFLGDDSGEAGPSRGASEPGLPDRLEAAAVSGLLYLSTRRGTECTIQAVRLPTLAVESGAPAPDCRFAVAPDGLLATGFDCGEAGALLGPDGAVVDRFDGCAPAWKPNGELTFVQRGDVMVVPRACVGTIDDCAQIALSHRRIRQALPAPIGRRGWTVPQLAWLDERVLGLIVRASAGTRRDPRTIYVVLAFDGQEQRSRPSFGTELLLGLAADRGGRRIFATGDVPGGVFELDEHGRLERIVTVPGIPRVASVAVSPDGSWLAAAGRGTVLVFQPGEPPGRSFQLPFAAESVVWREP